MFNSSTSSRTTNGVKVNVQAPRGSAKTTCCAIWYPLWRICFKAFQIAEGVPDEKFILIISRNQPMAKGILENLKRLTENPEIVRDFGNLAGRVWKKDECETANGVAVRVLGRKQSPRGALVAGKRPSLVIVDDLEDPKRCMNPDLRDEDSDWLFSDIMFASGIEGNLNVIYADTVKHPDSLSMRLTQRPGWNNVHFKAIPDPGRPIPPTHEHLWKEWEAIYADLTLDDAEREAKADEFYNAHQEDMNAGVTALWPEALSYFKVRKIIAERGYHYTLRELQNIARDSSMSMFDMDNAMTFEVVDAGLKRSDDRIVEWHQIGGFTTYLDTMGGRDAQQNSYACAVVVVWEPLPGGRKFHPDSFAGVNGYILNCWMGKPDAQSSSRMAFFITSARTPCCTKPNPNRTLWLSGLRTETNPLPIRTCPLSTLPRRNLNFTIRCTFTRRHRIRRNALQTWSRPSRTAGLHSTRRVCRVSSGSNSANSQPRSITTPPMPFKVRFAKNHLHAEAARTR